MTSRPGSTPRCGHNCSVLATEPENRLAAIVDFTFNLGVGRLQTSTLRRRINQRDWVVAGQDLSGWVYGGGRVLPGLVLRRHGRVRIAYCSGPMKFEIAGG
jgi:lysozyme